MQKNIMYFNERMYSKKNFTAIIPARALSKEIKSKNLVTIGDHPLVSYSIEAAKKSKFIKDIYVSTDGKNIAKIAKKYGAKVIIRPKHLSQDFSQVEDAVIHAIKIIEKLYRKKVDNIVLMQPTSPQRKINDVDNAIRKFIKDKADSLFSCVRTYPYLWEERNFKNAPLNFNPLKRVNRQNRQPQYIENGSIYVTKRKIYKNNRCRVGGKITKYVMSKFSEIELDGKADVEYLSMLLNSKIIKKFKLVEPKKI